MLFCSISPVYYPNFCNSKQGFIVKLRSPAVPSADDVALGNYPNPLNFSAPGIL